MSAKEQLKAGYAEYRRRLEAGEVDQAPPEHNLIRRAKNNPNSKKAAIHANCFDCMGGTEDDYPDPGWREAIANCTSINCRLMNFRPFQNLTQAEIEADRQQSEAENAEAELEEVLA